MVTISSSNFTTASNKACCLTRPTPRLWPLRPVDPVQQRWIFVQNLGLEIADGRRGVKAEFLTHEYPVRLGVT